MCGGSRSGSGKKGDKIEESKPALPSQLSEHAKTKT